MRRAHEGKSLVPLGAREATVPLLTLLTDIDGIQQVRAWAADAFIPNSAEIGDGNALDWRLRQEKITDRGVRGLGEAFQLL